MVSLGRPCCIAGDIALYEHELALLEPGQWLNDSLIAFAFELLAAEVKGRAKILLLEPSIVFTAGYLQQPDVLREMMSARPHKDSPALSELLPTSDLVLMPINDKEDPDQHVGGAHWSLLCYRRQTNAAGCFEHYDSCASHNLPQAKAVARCFSPLVGHSGSMNLVQMKVPQQANGHDCGVYVLGFAERLCYEFIAFSLPPPGETAPSINKLTPTVIAQQRTDLLQKLMALAAERQHIDESKE